MIRSAGIKLGLFVVCGRFSSPVQGEILRRFPSEMSAPFTMMWAPLFAHVPARPPNLPPSFRGGTVFRKKFCEHFLEVSGDANFLL